MIRRTLVSTLFPYTTLFRSSAEQALGYGEDLVGAYRMGLEQPLAFLPGAAWAWAEAREDQRDRKAALVRSEEHTSELQSRPHLVCRLLLEKKNSDGMDSSSG